MIFPDTDVMIEIMRQRPNALAWVQSLGNDLEIALSGFVAMELLQGCRDKAEMRETQEQLSLYRIIWPSDEVCDDAMREFSSVRLSHGIGILDMLIGKTAVALDLPLQTFNQKHYQAISGLRVVVPYVR